MDGLVIFARRMSPRPNPLTPYAAPFVVFMLLLGAVQAIGSAFTHSGSFLLAEPKYWIYPAQTILCAAMLWRFWSSYQFRKPEKIGLTLFLAILVLAIWISPQEIFGRPRRYDGFDPTLFGGNRALFATTLALRFTRLVIVVPLVEEIFWRGFLLRYVIREDFEKVPPGTFSRMSFGVVAGCFALAHWGVDFIPALLTGAIYNFLIYRTRSLSSCVLAHAVTNLGLGIYIMATRQWGFW